MTPLQLLRLIRTICNSVLGDAQELEKDQVSRHVGILGQIQQILIKENINEN
jgi:hypothetical protein